MTIELVHKGRNCFPSWQFGHGEGGNTGRGRSEKKTDQKIYWKIKNYLEFNNLFINFFITYCSKNGFVSYQLHTICFVLL